MSDSIVLTTTGSGQAGVSSGSDIISQVARIVGGEGEILIRQQAADCVNRVRIELNQYEFAFTKTTAPTVTLVNGTDTYALPTAFNRPSYARLIDAQGNPYRTLDYYDEHSYAHINQTQQNVTGLPLLYTLRNSFGDGLITLFPIPDSVAAANYRLVDEYYARIGAIADTPDPVNLPEECTNTLVVGGQAYLLREREKQSPVTAQAFTDYQRAKFLLVTWDRRFSEESGKFRLRPRRTFFDPTLYIRVS